MPPTVRFEGLSPAFAGSAQEQIRSIVEMTGAPPVVERRVELVEVLDNAVFLHVAFFSVHCAIVAVQVAPAALLVVLVSGEDCLVHVY